MIPLKGDYSKRDLARSARFHGMGDFRLPSPFPVATQAAARIMLWAKVFFGNHLPRWWLDVATAIHYYEAVLATLAIVVWHFYHVMFDPDVYPINTACLDGRVSEEFQAHEHPLERQENELRTDAAAEESSGK